MRGMGLKKRSKQIRTIEQNHLNLLTKAYNMLQIITK